MARLCGSPAKHIEQVAEVDVGHVAHRDNVREADAMCMRPVDEPRHERTGLREKGGVAFVRHALGEARIDADSRQDQAEAVGADNPQAIRLSRLECGAAKVRAEPCMMTTTARVPLAPSSAMRAGTVAGGVAMTARSGSSGRLATEEARDTVDVRILGVDEIDVAGEPAREKIGGDDASDAARFGTCADECDGAGRKQMVEIADRHSSAPL